MLQPDTTLVLGDFTFSATEIPAEIPWGGSQRAAVHELVGGGRVVDAMGRSDRPLEWSGWFLGDGASARARFLDGLRIGGAQQVLAWGPFRYLVLVQDFHADYRKRFEIPYRISCTVIADQTTPVTSAGTPPVDTALDDDVGAAEALAALLQAQAAAAMAAAVAQIQALVGAISTAMSAVPSFQTAPRSTVTAVAQTVSSALTAVNALAAASDSSLGETTGFAGLVQGAPAVTLAGTLLGQSGYLTQQSTTYQLRAVLGRLVQNLGSLLGSERTVATAGGDLFRLAQQQYGDATAWTTIARANGLVDPFIAEPTVLGIPDQPDTQDGVLSA